MNDFKKQLQENCKKKTDELIFSTIVTALKNVCNSKKNKEENTPQIKNEIKDRIEKLSKIFINYERNMEYIYPRGLFDNEVSKKLKINKTDIFISNVVEESLNVLYNKIKNRQQKEQIIDRMVGVLRLLENFDENYLRLQKMEMQQTKLGELLIAER